MSVALHITGASGAGTTTLGRAVAASFDLTHLDADDFYWVSIEPKYGVKRVVEERLKLLEAAFASAAANGWVLSGSVGDWARPIVHRFAHVVFLSAPTELRVARLRQREMAEFGDVVAPGGVRHEEFTDFLAWAAAYDDGTREGRNRARHEVWLAGLSCPVLRLDGARPIDELTADVVAFVRAD